MEGVNIMGSEAPKKSNKNSVETGANLSEDTYIISSGQLSLLFHSLSTVGSGVDIEQMVIVCPEGLDAGLMRQAWNEVMKRHTILRTRFQWEQLDEPHQEVMALSEIPFQEDDWSKLPEAEREEQLELYLEKDRRNGFDLAQAPCMRILCARWRIGEFRLIWTFHHVLLDGYSFPIVLGEVFDVYRAWREGSQPNWSDAKPYRCYIDWLKTRDVAGESRFWRELLGGFLVLTPLPGAHKETRTADVDVDYATASHEVCVSGEETMRLGEFAHQHGVTINTLVQGAWALLLSRYSGESDVVFGATRACRHFTEGADSMVGLFINTLPVRVNMPDHMEVAPWLASIREQSLRVRPYEHTPLAEVVHLSDVRQRGRLFDSIVVFENLSLLEKLIRHDPTWAQRSISLIERTALPLALSATVSDDGLHLEVSYREALFERAVMQNLAGQMVVLLNGMISRPSQKISDLPWLTKEDHLELQRFNQTEKYYDESRLVHQLVEDVARRTPDAEAVVYGQGRLTYRELNDRSNRLAHYLIGLGVKPGTPVGICVDRGVEMIMGIFGILKAGGSYVPLDLFYPKERLVNMLENSGLSILVTLQRLLPGLPRTSAQKVFLDVEHSLLAGQSSANPDVSVSLEDPVYVIFTSGTTGKPKAVMTKHGNLLNAYRAWEDIYDLHSVRAHLQMASFSFDVFAGDMVRALCAGAKLVICPQEFLLKPEELYGLMRHEGVEGAEFVPMVLRNLIEYLRETGQNLSFLRLLVAGSDIWYMKEYREFHAFCGRETRLVNSYGITETTIDTTYFEGDMEGCPDDILVPIGRPFPNNRVYILDANGHPVPVAVTGELYIGGKGVTRGYLNEPFLSAEKFLPDPFAEGKEERMYRTGDCGRYMTSGHIELLGRADNQVKIRGFRIELGEVEVALKKFPGVADAVVAAREVAVGEKRLVAYLVKKADASISLLKLRSFLKERLPYYSIPAAFVEMDALPVTPNGKVDRRALPLPEETGIDLSAQYVPPRTETEKKLVEIWQKVLGASRIGVRDNFFELGGHSLMAVRLFSLIKKTFYKDLPIASLFQGLTVEQMAVLLGENTEALSCVVPLKAQGSRLPLFFLHTIGGDGSGGMFRYRQICRYLPPDLPVYGVRAPAEPFMRMDEMAAYYIQEIRGIQPKGPYALGGYCFGGNVAFEMAQQLMMIGEKISFLCMIESMPYYGGEGPLHWNWKSWQHYLHHLWCWTLGFARRKPSYHAQWLRRKIARLYKKITRKAQQDSLLDLHDFLEMTEHSPEYRRYVEAHWEALSSYQPRPYPGEVTLFRIRTQPFKNFDHTLWWGEFAEGGVDVHIIEGTHETIFNTPTVQKLAHSIQQVLEAVDD